MAWGGHAYGGCWWWRTRPEGLTCISICSEPVGVFVTEAPHANFLPNSLAASESFIPNRSNPATVVVFFVLFRTAVEMLISALAFFLTFPPGSCFSISSPTESCSHAPLAMRKANLERAHQEAPLTQHIACPTTAHCQLRVVWSGATHTPAPTCLAIF